MNRLLDGIPNITPEMARHVLFHFGDPNGYEAGSFTVRLVELIAHADVVNKARLSTAYPEYVAAVVLAQEAEDGIRRLIATARGERLPGCPVPGQPGYVVGDCGHRVAGSEWRAGFRTCERCPARQEGSEQQP